MMPTVMAARAAAVLADEGNQPTNRAWPVPAQVSAHMNFHPACAGGMQKQQQRQSKTMTKIINRNIRCTKQSEDQV
jgi:hypothetical protein